MSTSTSTLVHTSSRVQDTRDAMAHMLAAGRVRAEREAAAQRDAKMVALATESATEWVEDIRAAGAVEVGFKICDDYGKARFRVPVTEAAAVLVAHRGEDVEAWGITADGEYVAEVW